MNNEKAAREEISALVKLDAAMAKEIEPLVEDKLRASLPNIELGSENKFVQTASAPVQVAGSASLEAHLHIVP